MNASFFEEGYRAGSLLGRSPNRSLARMIQHDDTVHGGVQAIPMPAKMLNKSGAPKDGRYGIIGYEEEANATELSQFADAGQSGDMRVKIEGELGRKFGIDWISTEQVLQNRVTPDG